MRTARPGQAWSVRRAREGGRAQVRAAHKGSDEGRESFPDGKLQDPRGSLEHDSHHFLKGLIARSLLPELNPDLGLFWDLELFIPVKALSQGWEQSNIHKGLWWIVTQKVGENQRWNDGFGTGQA